MNCVCSCVEHVLPRAGRQTIQQGAAMRLSALSWFSSAAEGSGGRQAFPGGVDPFCLSGPGQDESEGESQCFEMSPQFML